MDNTGYSYEYKHDSYLIIPEKIRNTDYSSQNKYQITGIICDKKTGEYLSGANIYIPEKNMFLSSSDNGIFTFTDSSNTPVRLVMRYLGYHSLDTTLLLSGSNSPFIFNMSEKFQMLDLVEVVTNKPELIKNETDAGYSTIYPARFVNLPNYGETDVFGTLVLLPGICNTGNSSELSVRGGYTDQNLVLFDGFTLYNLDHFFGAYSPVNPNVIKDLQIYKGGYDSRYGERVSGIIDITGKSGSQTNPAVYGGINLLNINLTAEIPLSKKLTLLAAGRKSYSNIYSTFVIENIYEDQFTNDRSPDNVKSVDVKPGYSFYDLNTKLVYAISDQEHINLSVYGGQDFLEVSNYTKRIDITSDIYDKNKWGNYGISTSWMKNWNEKLFSAIQLGISGYGSSYYNRTIIQQDSAGFQIRPAVPVMHDDSEFKEYNDLKDYSLSVRGKYQLNQKNRFDFGIIARNYWYKYHVDEYPVPVVNSSENSSRLYSIYLQDEMNPFPDFYIKPGFRINYYGNTRKIYHEPRLSVNYNPKKGVLFKFATGRYYQFMSQISSDQAYGYNRDFWVLADNTNHPVLASDHFIIGTNFEFDNFTFDVECYYKTLKGLQKLLFISEFQEYPFFDMNNYTNPSELNGLSQSKIISGNGKAYGIDFLFKYEKKYLTSWISYSIGKSLQNFRLINQNEDIPAPHDQTRTLDWVNMISLKNWNFSTVYTYATGQPYISRSISNEDFETIRIYRRLPAYSRFDVAMNYNFRIKNVSLKAGISVINLFNRQNYYDIDRRRFNFENISINETDIIKSQGLIPNIFLNFRF